MADHQRQLLRSISVSGFRSLEEVKVPLGPLTVLVGPNGSGKSNVLEVLRLLVETIRFASLHAYAHTSAPTSAHTTRSFVRPQALRRPSAL